ncbi:hypothetical protein FJT64_025089 [Amphibalanus amphitrite]|uniref:Uncharacterized protein n=1 Tax=Amphibalanus amphitrite TaxID=1232801 RepID=A0A6A4W6A3_AMPAM|nr:hypothetical protein FJT64_025089 [Amphibalanus amphitrite]
MSHIGRTPQAVRTFMLNKARKIRRSRSASQGRSQQRTLSEDPDMGPDDVIIDSSVPHRPLGWSACQKVEFYHGETEEP